MNFKKLIIFVLWIMFDSFTTKKMKLTQPLMGLGTESFVNKLPKPIFQQGIITKNNDNIIHAEIIPPQVIVPTNVTTSIKPKKLNNIIKPKINI